MKKKTSSNQPCRRDSEYVAGAFLKSFSICALEKHLSYDVASGSERHAIKLMKKLVVYRLSGNDMTPITPLRIY